MSLDLRGNRYAPSAERNAALLNSIRPLLSASSSGFCLLELDGSLPESDLCRALECQVFDDAFGDIVPHSPDMMTVEYGPHEEQSRFFAVFKSSSGELAGMVRTIDGFPNKTVSDLARAGHLAVEEVEQRYGLTETNTRDLGSVAVAREFRGTLGENVVAASLYRVVYVTSLRDEITDWTGVVDTPVLAKWHQMGIPFRRLADVEDLVYLGSSARACHLQVDAIRPSMDAAAAVVPDPVRELIRGMLDGSERLAELSQRTVPARSYPEAARPDVVVDLTSEAQREGVRTYPDS